MEAMLALFTTSSSLMHLWYHTSITFCIYVKSQIPPPCQRLLVWNRAVSKISDFAKDGNSQNRNVLNISTNILHDLPKCSGLTAVPGLQKKAVPLHWLLPFSFQKCQGTVEQRAAPKEEHKSRSSCQLLKLGCNTKHHQGLQPNVQTKQNKITINNCCRDNHTKFPTQYLVCHVSPN